MTLGTKKYKEIGRLRRLGAYNEDIAKKLRVGKRTIERVNTSYRRILVVSDLHCGARYGMAPPRHDKVSIPYDPFEFWDQATETWDWWTDILKLLGEIDIMIVCGDAIDGRGNLSRGVEQVTTNRIDQAMMAYDCLKIVKPKHVEMVFGTPYHVGKGESFERLICQKFIDSGVSARISDHAKPIVNNYQFDIRHKVGKSSVPYGGMTPLMKQKVWNTIWTEQGGQKKANVIIRGHIHEHLICSQPSLNFLAFSCPTLCGWGSKYGQQQCDGLVQTGLVVLDIPTWSDDVQDIKVIKDIPKLKCQQAKDRII